MATTNFTTGTVIEAAWLNDADAHVYDEAGAKHTADKITVTPAGNITEAEVQAALEELDGLITSTAATLQPIDDTLTALAGLATGADKIPYSTGTDTFGELTFSTATALGSSDTTIPSQNAIKTYVDAQALTSDFIVGTPVDLNGTGTSVEFTVATYLQRRVTIIGRGISLNGSANLLLQYYDGSSWVTSGYNFKRGTITGSAALVTTDTTGCLLRCGASGSVTDFVIHLDNMVTTGGYNSLVVTAFVMVEGATDYIEYSVGTFYGDIGSLRLISNNGTDTFDAGWVVMHYEELP